MSGTKPASMFGRMRSLIRGWFSLWVRDREFESPEAIYEQAIRGRVTQYRELKDAVAGILYMRSKLDAEITERRAEIARLHDETRRALTRSDEEACLTLISHKQVLFDDLERAEQELGAVRLQADEAKANLVRFRGEIRSLVREKGRMLATLANAKARRRLQSAMEGLSVEAEMEGADRAHERRRRARPRDWRQRLAWTAPRLPRSGSARRGAQRTRPAQAGDGVADSAGTAGDRPGVRLDL
ncbi:MAG: PspA/IM30 family protein [Deltaproteobacteria bacterium]|nr:PspA/IM30 family protein [Deltaproteobacteria bacterium]